MALAERVIKGFSIGDKVNNAVCVFYQGQGLLLSDDDTALHGEFSDDWTVNGKVERISVSFNLCVLAVCQHL